MYSNSHLHYSLPAPRSLLTHSLHTLQIIRNDKLRTRLTLDLLNIHTGRQLRQRQATISSIDLENTLNSQEKISAPPSCLSTSSLGIRMETYQVGNYGADDVGACQWERTLFYDFGRPVFRDVLGGDDDLRLVWVGDEVHCSSHAFKYLCS